MKSFPHKTSKVVRSTDGWGKNAHCEVAAAWHRFLMWQVITVYQVSTAMSRLCDTYAQLDRQRCYSLLLHKNAPEERVQVTKCRTDASSELNTWVER